MTVGATVPQAKTAKPNVAKSEAAKPDTAKPASKSSFFNLRTDAGEPADWVKETRRPEDQLDYIPLGTRRQDPPVRLLSRAEVMAQEQSLLAVQRRHDAISGRKADNAVVGSAAGVPFVKKVRVQPRCALTCIIDVRKPPALLDTGGGLQPRT